MSCGKSPLWATWAHWELLISVSIALDQTTAYTARPGHEDNTLRGMHVNSQISLPVEGILLLLLLLLNAFDNAPVCRRVTDESWAQSVTWRVSKMRASKDEYAVTKLSAETVSYLNVQAGMARQSWPVWLVTHRHGISVHRRSASP